MPGGVSNKSSRWARGGGGAIPPPIEESAGNNITRWGSRFGWTAGQKDIGNEEETQGLLIKSADSLRSLAEQAGAKIGGHTGAALQAATISQDRWMLFFVLLALGSMLMFLSYLALPMIVLAPHKFALVFTGGTLCFFGAMTALKGVKHFVQHLMSEHRRALTASYVASMFATLWASLYAHSAMLTMIFSGLQILQLVWFLVAYIPGGTTALGYVQGLVIDNIRNCCCSCCCFAKGSVPL